MRSTNFNRQCLYHLCKISHDGSVVFYSISDFLVFTTVVFVYAARRGVVITELCIMRNHFHIAAYADSRDIITLFYKDICSQFSRIYNRREGKIKLKWKEGSNISEKRSPKDKRSLYLYIAGNAPLKKCCTRVEGYKWNFLATGLSNDKQEEKEISKNLELAEALVRESFRLGRPVSYEFLNHYGKTLKKSELNILTDYILQTYLNIDFRDICSLFGAKESFIASANMANGFDHDTEDDFSNEDYRHYSELTSLASRLGFCGNDSKIHEKGFDLYNTVRTLAFETNANNLEISRFLHIPIATVEAYTCRKY